MHTKTTTSARVDINRAEPRAYEVMRLLEQYIKEETDISPLLYELIKIRASQINGCAYCVNMHTRDARKLGETEQRIYALSVWRDAPFFSDEERAVLAFTEEVTCIGATHHVSDEVYNQLARLFDEKRIAQLLMAIITINGWNRIGVTTKLIPD